jgi:hypothetical protein
MQVFILFEINNDKFQEIKNWFVFAIQKQTLNSDYLQEVDHDFSTDWEIPWSFFCLKT